MIKADKKFQGGRRYYHRHAAAGADDLANPSWPERQRKMIRDGRLARFRIFAAGVVIIGVVVGAFYLLGQ